MEGTEGKDMSGQEGAMGRKTARVVATLVFFALIRPCFSALSLVGLLLSCVRSPIDMCGVAGMNIWPMFEMGLYSTFTPLVASLLVLALRCIPAAALAFLAYRYLVRRSFRQVCADCASHKARTWTLFVAFAIFSIFSFNVRCEGVSYDDPRFASMPQGVDWVSTGEDMMPSWDYCDFAARLYRESAPKSPEENFVVSPCGLASGLALMGNGSGGDTAKEFRRALSMQEALNCDIEQVRGDFRDIAAFQASALRAASDGQSHVETDNALWLAQDVQMNWWFENAAGSVFGAEKLKGDAKKAIGKFVSGKMRGMASGSAIQEVDPLARMIAVNVVRFSGTWKRPFRRIETYTCPFKAPGGEVSVPFMHSLMKAELCECDGAKALRLPYSNEKLEMVFVLPPEGQHLAWLEERLDSDFLGRLLASAQMMDDVDVALPKFEIECSLSLKGTLAAMGLEKAFGDGADFSAIAREPLYLSDVEQSAVLRVDEAGTEAAAATKVRALCAAAGTNSFEAYRPFLFVLREKAHGVVLFIGRVATPRSRQGA